MKKITILVIMLLSLILFFRGADHSSAQSNNYVYRVNPTGYVCGTTGQSPNIVNMRLVPDDNNHDIQVRVEKCAGGSLSQSGRVYLTVNGVRRWGPVYYSSGTSSIRFDIDPVAMGITGSNNYLAEVLSNDQPTIPKHTGTITAWEEYTGPDLRTSSESIQGSAPFYPGGTIYARSRVRSYDENAGSSDLGFWISSSNDGNPINSNYKSSNPIQALSEGGSSDYSYEDVPIPLGLSLGTYYVVFEADTNHAISENNEGNNRDSRSFTVAACSSGTLFCDVPSDHALRNEIEALYNNNITSGCRSGATPYNNLPFCPDARFERWMAAVFLLRAKHGASYQPPNATTQIFNDVPLSYPWVDWINQLYNEDLTEGCHVGSGVNFCPDYDTSGDYGILNRGDLAVFLARMLGWDLNFPISGVFVDVTGSGEREHAIEYMWWQGYTNGDPECESGEEVGFCPDKKLDRGHATAFISRAAGFVSTAPRCASLTVNTSPFGTGNVTQNPSSPDCPIDGSKYKFDTPITLNANPNSGYNFDSWSGYASGTNNPTTITLDRQNRSVTANFTTDSSEECVSLTYTSNNTAWGSVSLEEIDNSVRCSTDSSKWQSDSSVRLRGASSSGYEFSHWEGVVCDVPNCETINPIIIALDFDRNITAHFVETAADCVSLSYNTNNSNWGTVSLEETPNSVRCPTDNTKWLRGSGVILRASSNIGYEFISWAGVSCDTPHCESLSRIPIGLDYDRNLTANFAEESITGTVLDVRYVDQVYVQQQQENGYWNHCGPASLAMLLHHQGLETRDVLYNRQATLDLVCDVKDYCRGGSIPAKIVSTMISQGLTGSAIDWTPTFQEIKQSIDNGYPVIFSMTNANHILLITGYDANNRIIVNDPYGEKSWWDYSYFAQDNHRNTPAGNTPQLKGENITYTYGGDIHKFYAIFVGGALSPQQSVHTTINTQSGGSIVTDDVLVTFPNPNLSNSNASGYRESEFSSTIAVTLTPKYIPSNETSLSDFHIFEISAHDEEGQALSESQQEFSISVDADPSILENWQEATGQTGITDTNESLYNAEFMLLAWDENNQTWLELPFELDEANGKINAHYNQFTEFIVGIKSELVTIEPPVLALSPATVSTGVGQTFDVAIEVMAGEEFVDGAAGYLNFDPAVLQVVSIAGSDAFQFDLVNQFDNSAGHVDFGAGSFSNYPSGTFTLATVTMQAIAETDGSAIEFNMSSPRQSDATFGGGSILNGTIGNTVIVSNAILEGSVTLQGRPSAPDARWVVPLRVSLTVPGEGTPAYEFMPTTDENGHFTLTGIDAGTYEVRVKHAHTLQNVQTVTLAAGSNAIDLGTLREGDANDDNFITIIDFSILAATFGVCEGDDGYDARADFNEDGCITIIDFSLLASNFGESGQSAPELRGSEQALEVALALEAAESSVRAGDTFTVMAAIQAGEQAVDGAQVVLKFDTELLEVVTVSGGERLPQGLQNELDNESGTLRFAAGTLEVFPNGTIELLEVEFRALAPTDATSLTFGEGTDVTFGGYSVLGEQAGGTIVISEPTAVRVIELAAPATAGWLWALLPLALTILTGAFISRRRR